MSSDGSNDVPKTTCPAPPGPAPIFLACGGHGGQWRITEGAESWFSELEVPFTWRERLSVAFDASCGQGLRFFFLRSFCACALRALASPQRVAEGSLGPTRCLLRFLLLACGFWILL